MDETIRFWRDLLGMRLVAGLGKHILLVDARYTSQKCSECRHTYKGNREGSAFRCRKCVFELHADLNASRNIAQAGISCLGRLPCQPANRNGLTPVTSHSLQGVVVDPFHILLRPKRSAHRVQPQLRVHRPAQIPKDGGCCAI